MFVVEPNARVMKVTGFLYGNEVPVETAADYYIACRGQEYSREALYSWYDIWDTHTRRRHNVVYWNMCSKRLLIRKELAEDVTVKPEVTVMEIGVEPIRIFPEWWWALTLLVLAHHSVRMREVRA
jgi:hypothetical protein